MAEAEMGGVSTDVRIDVLLMICRVRWGGGDCG